jgi:hypothetical protein
MPLLQLLVELAACGEANPERILFTKPSRPTKMVDRRSIFDIYNIYAPPPTGL